MKVQVTGINLLDTVQDGPKVKVSFSDRKETQGQLLGTPEIATVDVYVEPTDSYAEIQKRAIERARAFLRKVLDEPTNQTETQCASPSCRSTSLGGRSGARFLFIISAIRTAPERFFEFFRAHIQIENTRSGSGTVFRLVQAQELANLVEVKPLRVAYIEGLGEPRSRRAELGKTLQG